MQARSLKRSIVLIGLMGSGKTSVGKRLACHLGADFYDSDDEIVAAAGRSIPEIFADFDEDYFRAGEARVLARLLAGRPSVIATGGGAFVAQANREAIAQSAVSVWLSAELDVLWSRVKDKTGRPLLQNDDPYGTLKKLAEERAVYYKQADLRVSSIGGDPHEAVVQKIIEAIDVFDATHPERHVFQSEPVQ
jgi:shikimate kinase